MFGGDRKLGAGLQWRNHRERERVETEQGAAQPVVFLAYTNMLAGKPQKQSKGKK